MASKSVIAGVYDFAISYDTCKRLEYQDYSEWMTGGQFEPPTTYTLRITTPGGKEIDLAVSAQAPNIIKPEQLGFSGCLPSGIYKFTALSGQGVGGKSYTAQVGIFCEEKCGLLKATSKLRPGDDDSQVSRITRYIAYAENSASLGDYAQAVDWIEIVNTQLTQLNCTCKCD